MRLWAVLIQISGRVFACATRGNYCQFPCKSGCVLNKIKLFGLVCTLLLNHNVLFTHYPLKLFRFYTHIQYTHKHNTQIYTYSLTHSTLCSFYSHSYSLKHLLTYKFSLFLLYSDKWVPKAFVLLGLT